MKYPEDDDDKLRASHEALLEAAKLALACMPGCIHPLEAEERCYCKINCDLEKAIAKAEGKS